MAAASAPLVLNGMNLGVLERAGLLHKLNNEDDKVLVLIQLQGGNDGLNMVIPLDAYDNLANLRGNIMIPEAQILHLTDLTGLHPSMTGLKAMWDNSRVNIVHSAGYPDQNRSHFRSTDIWTSAANSDEYISTGWLGRHFDPQYPGFPTDYPNEANPDPIAIAMGSVLSETCQGLAANYCVSVNDPFGISPLLEGETGVVIDEPYGWELAFLRTAISSTNAYGDVIGAAATAGNNMVTYPDTKLGEQLKNVALLISGGLKTKVYVCSLGGFDTHSGQVEVGNTAIGDHADLLTELSEAVAAFQADIQAQSMAHRVIGMTFSEFGRQIASNGSSGTDHGSAAPLLLFGSCVRPGFTGENPEIPTVVASQEGVAMQHDFRNIYGSVLIDWFGITQQDVESYITPNFTYIPLIDCAVNAVAPIADMNMNLTLTPNPFSDRVQISFVCPVAMRVRLQIYGTLGHIVETVFDRQLLAGQHRFTYVGSHLPAGNYYCQLQMGSNQKTKLMVKI